MWLENSNILQSEIHITFNNSFHLIVNIISIGLWNGNKSLMLGLYFSVSNDLLKTQVDISEWKHPYVCTEVGWTL